MSLCSAEENQLFTWVLPVCVCVCVGVHMCVHVCVCVCVCGGGTCVLATFTLYMSHSAILWVVVQKQAAYLPET